MKPDLFMPFFGNDFFQAVEGRGATVSDGYLRALWYYWHQTHCSGIDNDEDLMRGLTRAPFVDWSKIKPLIFGKFFYLADDGKWHNRRAYDEWQRCSAILEARRKGAEATNRKRWRSQ